MKHLVGILIPLLLSFPAGAQEKSWLNTDSRQLPRDYRQRTPIIPVAPQLFEQVPWQQLAPGLRRKVLFNDRMTMVLLEMDPAPTLEPLTTHYHAHDQITMVLEGRGRVQLGDEVKEVGPGAAYVAPSNVRHGLQPLTSRFVLVECFTPTREDFRGMSAPPAARPCSLNQVKALVYHWFALFDRGAAASDFLLCLEPGLPGRQPFSLSYPDAKLHDSAQFTTWLDQIQSKYPRVRHDLRKLEVSPESDGFKVTFEVGWSSADGPPLWFAQTWHVRDWGGFPVIREIQVNPL